MQERFHSRVVFILFCLLLSACTVGPNYVRPPALVPPSYKETGNGWVMAEPDDDFDRGDWWAIFHNEDLDRLEPLVNVCNQNVAAAAAAYQQAVALVWEAAASYFPTVTGTASVLRQKQSALIPSGPSVATFGGSTNTIYTVGFNGSWVPDLWGAVRRQVEENADTAQADAATLDAMRLSMQATLAQDYFQLRTLDNDQKILDDTVIADRKALVLTQSGFKQGTTSSIDIAQAEAQLKTAQAAAIDNGVNRALFEHAIAVLVGIPASEFYIKPETMALVPPFIPPGIPSTLLQRRPDIAAAERDVAAANAGIGVAIAAFFPSLTLTGSVGYESFSLSHLFSKPMLFWSLGAALTETIIDGGLRIAQTAAAKALYYETIAQYRQTVLAAFQNVEDNLAAQRILRKEIYAQHQAVVANRAALRLALTEYQQGTVAYTTVIVAQTNTYTAEKSESDIAGRRMVAAVGLIEGLGGGWDTSLLPSNVSIAGGVL